DVEAPSDLWHIDLSAGRARLGGSCLLQAYDRRGGDAPDLDEPLRLQRLFALLQQARARDLVRAYHDVSDGGLLVTLAEMAFASHCGLEIDLAHAGDNVLAAAFAEELGVVVQVHRRDRAAFERLLVEHKLFDLARPVAVPVAEPVLRLDTGDRGEQWGWSELMRAWARTPHAMQRLRDDPLCADEEQLARCDLTEPGLRPVLTFDPDEDIAAPYIGRGVRPSVAILREQGVNGQVEMAAAFERAGFRAIDVHMSDLAGGRRDLAEFAGLAACGGFSYGDVLGAGRGWATAILENPRLRDMFAAFFARGDRFALGVCNGCQMLSQLRDIIPGTRHWPAFVRNRSEQYEARLAQVEVTASPSWLFDGMAGSRLPVVVAHGEGRADFVATRATPAQARVCLRYVDGHGAVATAYPANPNGSPGGITGLCNDDGRVTILMPHPE